MAETIALEKCPSRPSKRRWASIHEAWDAADARTEEVGIEIVPYRCDDCGFLHLTKRTGGTSEIERRSGAEVFPPTNPPTRRAALRTFLEGRTEVASIEVREALDFSQHTTSKYMMELGWVNSGGRTAKWRPTGALAPTEVKLHAVEKPVDKPVDMSMRRHPASRDAGWRQMENLDPLRHMALGDLLDTLRAAGMEVRITVREAS